MRVKEETFSAVPGTSSMPRAGTVSRSRSKPVC